MPNSDCKTILSLIGLKGTRVLLASLPLLAVTLAFCAEAQPAPPSTTRQIECLLLTAEGKVEVSPVGQTEWTTARTNQVLRVGDRVRTGARSRSTIRLTNLSVLRVNELTTLQIQAPSGTGQQPGLDLKSGAAYFFHRDRPEEMQFRTPLASGAIRGTEFHLAVAEDGRTELAVLDGEVDLKNDLAQVILKSGEQGIAEKGRPPTKTAVISAINLIQWTLYYPGVLDVDELALTANEKQRIAESLEAYRKGDLLAAVKTYDADKPPGSDAESVYRAALLLAAGQVEQAEKILASLNPSGDRAERLTRLANALRRVIAAVKSQADSLTPDLRSSNALATEWLAESYYLQSRSQLPAALDMARKAVRQSPAFGFGWVHVAELEFSFGRVPGAREALEKGLELSPRNAQGQALKGFLLSAENKFSEAVTQFDRAIEIDGGLANAWLGRGLCLIRKGQRVEGRESLQTAATLEPQRAVLRSYLGKALSNTKDYRLAERELARAKEMDANDPTAWLYSALLDQQENRINEAVRELEHSQDLNTNRSVFRSRLLLDQDRAVRSANLAAIYKDDGMFDVSVREASRAVNYDYGNYSAHLFLANSYDALRDPKQINLRYETPAFSELLVANLLAPVGGGALSQNVSQQEYSKLFESNHVGISSSTEYFSSGDWVQYGSQYGILGNSSYSLDAYYRTEAGQRPNNDLQRLDLSAKFKQQITPQDSVFLQVLYYDFESGDVAQYYNQNQASQALHVTEKQEPNLFLGYHHEWSPGLHTLFLAGRLDDTLTLDDPAARILFLRKAGGRVTSVTAPPFDLNYRSELEAYSTELQQIWQTPAQTLVVGARYQTGWSDTSTDIDRQLTGRVSSQSVSTDLERISFYGYEQWQILEPLRLTAGLSYDRLKYPQNIDTSPVTDAQATKDQVSPKVGLLWTPLPRTNVRGAYTRSLGGVFYDTSVRLEPTQVAGFNQAFRSLIPESAVGLVPGTRFETFGLGVDHTFKTRTYLGVEGEILKSDGSRTVGVFTNATFLPIPDSPSSTTQDLQFEEKTLMVTLNQLITEEWSLGARYRLSHADFTGRFGEISSTAINAAQVQQDQQAMLQQLNLFLIFNHRSGVFAQFDALWTQQNNQGYTPDIPGDDFWQFNVYAGYRFLRRAAEVRIGILNLTDRDYRLNPLNLYSELPRERTFTASLRFYF